MLRIGSTGPFWFSHCLILLQSLQGTLLVFLQQNPQAPFLVVWLSQPGKIAMVETFKEVSNGRRSSPGPHASEARVLSVTTKQLQPLHMSLK